MVGLTSILKEARITAHDAIDKRVKIQALSLAKECYSMKLDLLTNSTVVDDAVRFVLEKTKANRVVIESEEEAIEDSDIQRSEDENKQSDYSTTTTTNQLF
jgi:preprotein translocase subunit Sec63